MDINIQTESDKVSIESLRPGMCFMYPNITDKLDLYLRVEGIPCAGNKNLIVYGVRLFDGAPLGMLVEDAAKLVKPVYGCKVTV